MKEVPVTATRRDFTGKGFARRERMAGNIPAVVYGPDIEPIPISVGEKALRAALRSARWASSIFDLNVDGKQNKVVVRELQRDPVTTSIIHIDFHAISMTKPLSISIPIGFVGQARGVKTDGGIMQITMRELEISCLPKDIPEIVEIDVNDLGIGDSVHVRDVSLPGVQILSPERRTIVVIAAPTVIKEAAPAEEEAVEGAEAEAAEVAEAAEGEEASKEEKKEEGKEKAKAKGAKE